MKPSKWQIVRVAHVDVFRAFVAMPRIVAIALLVCLVQTVITEVAVPAIIGEQKGLANESIMFALGLVAAFVLTPFLIAVHRFILLDEVTSSYRLDVHDPRFMQFFGYSAMIAALVEIPTLLNLFWANGYIPALVAVTLVSLQLVLIFPAIAIDAPGANPVNAMADSKGHLWFTLLTCVMACIPLVIVWMPVFTVDYVMQDAVPYKPTGVVVLISAVFLVWSQAVLVAVASHLFRAFAHRLKLGRHGTPMVLSH
jgi:hypothetical protein